MLHLVEFRDESREIASEYQNGSKRYAAYDEQCTKETKLPFSAPSNQPPRSSWDHDNQRPGEVSRWANKTNDMPSLAAAFAPNRSLTDTILPNPEEVVNLEIDHGNELSSDSSIVPQATNSDSGDEFESEGAESPTGPLTPPRAEKAVKAKREFLRLPDEIYYMRVFVEDVGIWMDCFDEGRHFSSLVPHQALRSPMLLNALLACGAKQTTLLSRDKDDKALCYYNTATTQLLRSLQNPDRNMSECAVAAVILNVYEIMSEEPTQRMNHIAGARALVRECGWDAKSTGIGAACFWLNIGMEVMDCLKTQWKTTWDPEHWNLEVGPHGQMSQSDIGHEERWVHQMLYLLAKIANFRASVSGSGSDYESPHHEQLKLSEHWNKWKELKELCDDWNNSCPRSMHPFAYKTPSATGPDSMFPEVW